MEGGVFRGTDKSRACAQDLGETLPHMEAMHEDMPDEHDWTAPAMWAALPDSKKKCLT